jgi:hypothetical protein
VLRCTVQGHHGGAGALLSVGLMRRAPLPAVKPCLDDHPKWREWHILIPCLPAAPALQPTTNIAFDPSTPLWIAWSSVGSRACRGGRLAGSVHHLAAELC